MCHLAIEKALKGLYAEKLKGFSPQSHSLVFLLWIKNAVVEIVDGFRQGIEARGVKAQKVILYGSHATGAGTRGSDIDVVVIPEDFIGKGFWVRIDIFVDVINEMSVPLEAVAMTPEEWEKGESLLVDFARKGEVLYAA